MLFSSRWVGMVFECRWASIVSAAFASSLLKEGIAMRVFNRLMASIWWFPLLIDDGCPGLSREQERQFLRPADNDPFHTAVQRGKSIVQFGDHSGKDQLFGLEVVVLGWPDPGDNGVFVVRIEQYTALLERIDQADV